MEKAPAMRRIHLENASASWGLLMQSGVDVSCTVGVPVADFLSEGLAIPDTSIAKIDAVFLDGMPVDDIAAAIVPDGARLALAAGLPGIAGLAMKRGSAVRALRGGITHVASAAANPMSGYVTLILYSLVIPMLAPLILRRGVIATFAQLCRYVRFAPEDVVFFEAGGMSISAWLDAFGQNPDEQCFFTADIQAG